MGTIHSTILYNRNHEGGGKKVKWKKSMLWLLSRKDGHLTGVHKGRTSLKRETGQLKVFQAIHKLAYQVRRICNYNVVSMLHFQRQLFWLVVIIKSELASILLKSFVILKKLHRDIMIKILKSDKGKNVS